MKKISSLEFALDFEMKGTVLYMKLAKKTKNLLGKRLFYSLAGQEVEHAERIDEIFEVSQTNKNQKIVLSKSLPSIESELKPFFLKAKKSDLKKDTENVSGYELAMQMETEGYNAYTNFYKKAGNEFEKNLFKQLAKEEKEHYDSLNNVYHYLAGTVDWFREEESTVWNWMNL